METNELQKKVEYYASLPYTIVIEHHEEQGGYYVARYIELPHFIMTGATPVEAVRELENEKREWFEENIKDGNKIPLPIKLRKYSGKIILRMPPALHEHLVNMTEIQGESLNSFMVKAVSLAADYVEPTKKYKVAVK
jgi:predicted HicB family RNase H-like nuclease